MSRQNAVYPYKRNFVAASSPVVLAYQVGNLDSIMANVATWGAGLETIGNSLH